MRIVFFTPYSVIWGHSFSEAMIAKGLQQEGHDVQVIGCDGAYKKACMGMTIYGLDLFSEDKKKQDVCKVCKKYRSALNEKLKFPSISIDVYIDLEDYKIFEDFNVHAQEEILSFEYEGIPIGRYSSYVLLLKYKKKAGQFSETEVLELWQECQYAFVTYKAFIRYFSKNPCDIAIGYNHYYPSIHLFKIAAENQGAIFYWHHSGDNLSDRFRKIQFGKSTHHEILRHTFLHWDQRESRLPVTQKGIQEVLNHYRELIVGRNIFVYSQSHGTKKDLRAFFNISENQSVCLVIMSSNDEKYGVQYIDSWPADPVLAFSSQLDWITQLLDYAKKRTDVFFIIRVHPREFPNRREKVLSIQLTDFLELFDKAPTNVRINWPDDHISLYDILKMTDLVLYSWSSVGKEASLLGIPALTYFAAGMSYPYNLTEYATSREDYFEKIDKLIHEKWSFERVRRAFRWCAIDFYEGLFDLSAASNITEFYPEQFFVRLFRRGLRLIWPEYQQYWNLWYFSRHQKKILPTIRQISQLIESGGKAKLDFFSPTIRLTEEQEEVEIKAALRQIMVWLYQRESPDNLSAWALYKKVQEV